MKIALSSSGKTLDCQLDPRLGRCEYFVLVDSETKSFEILDNPGINASGGAGIKASQALVDSLVEVLITGSVGPNAWDILKGAGVKIYKSGIVSLKKALEDFEGGKLESIEDAGPSHAGMRQS